MVEGKLRQILRFDWQDSLEYQIATFLIFRMTLMYEIKKIEQFAGIRAKKCQDMGLPIVMRNNTKRGETAQRSKARERGESVTSSSPVYPKECLRDHIVERC